MLKDRIKILFELKRGEDGYPPADIEQLWALPLGNNLFKIDNIPFFVTGISCEDVVEASADSEGELRYKSLVTSSPHNTLRVILFRESPDTRPLADRVSDLRSQLARIGCSTELSHMPGLVAVDADPASINNVIGVLQSGEKANLWEYEEAALRT
ncbi:MAG: DUF4265 domain-containing protein [Acidobacteriota bacterium]|nr:DUF4265 domain-containing protein [Acidobacteriota bacterium]